MKKVLPFFFVILSFSLIAQEKTFIRDFTYNASDLDSKVSCRAIAKKELRSLLLDEIGSYVESESILTTSEVGDKFSQDFVENISTISAGITKFKILEETWNGKTFWMKASITIDKKSLEESLKQLIADRQKIKELEQTKQKLKTSEKEIARINKELDENKSANLEEIAEKYNAEIKMLVAIDYYESGWDKAFSEDYAGAIVDLTIAIKSNPNYADAYVARGYAYYDLGKYKSAIADYTTAIRLDPDAYAYYNRGNAYFDLGEYNTAIADYTTAIRLDPDDADAYNNRGNAYGDLGEYNTAIADYTTAIRLDPDDASAYYNRGCAYADLGEYKSAIADYTTAIRLDPDDAVAYNNRGNAYMPMGNYNTAIADYTTAIRLNPDYASAYYNRGCAYYDLGKYKSAIADYTTAIRLDPDYANAYNNRGVAKAKAGLSYCSDFKKACELGANMCCEWYDDNCR